MTESNPTLSDVFAELADVASDAAVHDRVVYGAQAKKLLTRTYPGFNERDYGFRKFVELLQAGHDQGKFVLEMVAGHPRLRATGSAEPSPVRTPNSRLKNDVWATVLTWEHGVRYFDVKRARALFMPTDDNGAPAWQSAPDDFVALDPVTMQQQLQWMGQFADEQEEPARSALQAALADPVPGAFKRALGQLSLQSSWTTRLQQRVTEHTLMWALRNGIPASALMEPRPRPPRAEGPRPEAARSAPRPSPHSPGEATDLRARLHQVIDQMSPAELASLSVPAAYLVS